MLQGCNSPSPCAMYNLISVESFCLYLYGTVMVAYMHFSHVSHIHCYSFLETDIVHYIYCVYSVMIYLALRPIGIMIVE
jgi:hypothetical protein